MMEAILRFLQDPRGVTSRKTAFIMKVVHLPVPATIVRPRDCLEAPFDGALREYECEVDITARKSL
jgi:hypothetical protein